jgi:hypothetical protein
MPSEYKFVVKHPDGNLSSLSIPAFLVENRVELWKAAFGDATARIREEFKNSPASSPQSEEASKVREKHKRYFNEYFELEGRAYTIVTQTEKAWIQSLGSDKLTEIGGGDRSAGIDEVLLAINQIADDKVEPLVTHAHIL